MHSIAKDIRDNPKDWNQSAHCFSKGSLQLWVCNGFLCFNLYESGKLNFKDKVSCYLAYRWWVKNAPIETFTKIKE